MPLCVLAGGSGAVGCLCDNTVLSQTHQNPFGVSQFHHQIEIGPSPPKVDLVCTHDLCIFQPAENLCNERGRALGWLFGTMAGGMAFGSTAGAILEPIVTWRGLFVGTAALSALVFVALLPFRALLTQRAATAALPLSTVLFALGQLVRSPRGTRTYAYVLFNGIFHSGVFTWLGLYLVGRFKLSPRCRFR